MNFLARHVWYIPCATILLAAAAGCGPARGDLAGKVSFQDKPVCSGSVLVRGSDGIMKASPIGAEGAYEVKNIAAGAIQVFVSSPDPGEAKVIARKPEEQKAPAKDRSRWFPIPEEYCKFHEPKLTFDLKSGPNTWDIVLK
jgi:hypothetical protein